MPVCAVVSPQNPSNSVCFDMTAPSAFTVTLSHCADFDGWRQGARALLAQGVPPDRAQWMVAGEAAPDLFAANAPPPPLPVTDGRMGQGAVVTPAFLDLARRVICHSSPDRLPLLYRLLWRQTHGERYLLAERVDSDMRHALDLAKAVGRAAEMMRAYVRFRDAADGDGPLSLAWFEPDHHVVERVAPCFIARMGAMRWSILTPHRTAHWDGGHLSFGPGCSRQDYPGAGQDDGDLLAQCWQTYYASTFNPGRVNPKAMSSRMPKKYWQHMDEAGQIPQLIRQAEKRHQPRGQSD